MNVDIIFETFNQYHVDYILIGGMNFLLRHKPVLTFDVDIWIDDNQANRARCDAALAELNAEWGKSDEDWKPVKERSGDWLAEQALFCLTSPHGAIDIFRSVAGLGSWSEAALAAHREATADGIEYLGLSDEDMLKCQYALEEGLQKRDRIQTLEQAIRTDKRDEEAE